MNLIKRILGIVTFLLLPEGIVAQQTVNNFTVKTNLVLRGLNVSTQLTPVPVELSTNWFNIATWGDSLTAGAGASPISNAYPATLGLLSGYTVSNGGVSSDTSGQIKARMLADTNSHVLPTIIWAGRNDVYTNAPANIIANIDNMIAALAAAGNTNRWLVLNVLNGNYTNYDWKGYTGYTFITNLNEQMRVKYGSRYVPIREALVAAYNPSLPQDVIDYGHDVPPNSLRSDELHLNNAGYTAVANYVLTNYQSVLRGDWPAFVSTKGLQIELASPPPIGLTTPGPGYFTSLASTTASIGSGSASVIWYSTVLAVGTQASNKQFTLSGSGQYIQSNAGLIPTSDAALDLGIVGTQRWRDGAFSRDLYAGSLNAPSAVIPTISSTTGTFGTITYSPVVAIGTSGTNKQFTLSGNGLYLQSNGGIIPTSDASLDFGVVGTQRWRDGAFSRAVYTGQLYAGTDTLVAAASGNVGIGTTSPTEKLTITSTSANTYFSVRNSGSSVFVMTSGTGFAGGAGALYTTQTNHPVIIGVGGGEVFRADGTTTTDDTPLTLKINGVSKRVTVGAADSGGAGYRILRVAN